MTNSNLGVARRHLDAIASAVSGDDLAKFFAPGMTIEEKPNRIYAKGQTREVRAMLEGHEKGKQLLRRQSYTVVDAAVEGDRVALQVVWEGVLAVPLGNLAPGATMRAFSAMFLTFKDGKVAHQVNYDCFEPY